MHLYGSVLFIVIVGCIGYFVVVAPTMKEIKRQELIRREPWREFD